MITRINRPLANATTVSGISRVLASRPEDGDWVLHFGKHKGSSIQDLTASYLLWLLETDECGRRLDDMIRAELASRGTSGCYPVPPDKCFLYINRIPESWWVTMAMPERDCGYQVFVDTDGWLSIRKNGPGHLEGVVWEENIVSISPEDLTSLE